MTADGNGARVSFGASVFSAFSASSFAADGVGVGIIDGRDGHTFRFKNEPTGSLSQRRSSALRNARASETETEPRRNRREASSTGVALTSQLFATANAAAVGSVSVTQTTPEACVNPRSAMLFKRTNAPSASASLTIASITSSCDTIARYSTRAPRVALVTTSPRAVPGSSPGGEGCFFHLGG